MLTLSIDPQLFSRFPALRVVGFLAADLNRAAAALSVDDLRRVWQATTAALLRDGITLQNVRAAAPIRSWREAYAASGLRPPTHTTAVETLVRRTLVDGEIVTPVRIVNLYCAIAVRHLVPVGGYDVDALPARTITVRHARPRSDWFVPCGARPSEVPANPDVPVFAAGEAVLSWAFNHHDSRHTCLRPETRTAVFFSVGVTHRQARTAAAALAELRLLLASRGAQVTRSVFADMQAPGAELSFEGERQ